jgi:hypothetical protein
LIDLCDIFQTNVTTEDKSMPQNDVLNQQKAVPVIEKITYQEIIENQNILG